MVHQPHVCPITPQELLELGHQPTTAASSPLQEEQRILAELSQAVGPRGPQLDPDFRLREVLGRVGPHPTGGEEHAADRPEPSGELRQGVETAGGGGRIAPRGGERVEEVLHLLAFVRRCFRDLSPFRRQSLELVFEPGDASERAEAVLQLFQREEAPEAAAPAARPVRRRGMTAPAWVEAAEYEEVYA